MIEAAPGGGLPIARARHPGAGSSIDRCRPLPPPMTPLHPTKASSVPSASKTPPDRQPLYQRVLEQLRADVQGGELHTRLPSEPELALRYRVSRMTLRRAISALVEDGLLESRHGAGTFVSTNAGPARTVALMINPVIDKAADDPYFQQLVSHLLHACARRGWTVRLASSIESMSSRLSSGRGASVAACIAVAFGTKAVDRLGTIPIPLVLVDSDPLPDVPLVMPDSAAALKAAVLRLAQLGHRRIVHSAGPAYAMTGRERLSEFRSAMKIAGLPMSERTVITGPFDMQHGYSAMAQWGSQPDRPTAVVCANDLMAFGAIHWLTEHGLVVGKDVSIVGCDGLTACSLVWPQLSTLALDFTAFAEAILQAVLDKRPGIRRIPLVLIERESMGPAPR